MDSDNLVIHKIFSQVSQRNPQKTVLQIKNDSEWLRYSYKETEDLSKKIGAFLIQEGFGKCDFASLILENRPEWAIIYLGIVRAGVTCVPLDPNAGREELKSLIDDCACRVIFSSQDIFFKKLNRGLKEGFKKIIVLDLDKEEEGIIDFSQIKSMEVKNITWPDVSPNDIASLIYTSGTTAHPKGVILSHYNLCSNFKSIKELNLLFQSDNILSLLPLYHTYAFMVTLLVPLCTGATITYCASFKLNDLIQTIREAGVTILVGVPQIFALIHKTIFEKLKKVPFFLRPLIFPFIKVKVRRAFGKDNLRLLVSGGARLSPKIAQDLSKFFKFIEGYGLTETSPVVTLNPLQRIKFGSVGRPIPGVQLKIFQPDNTGVGEVLIKGPNVMQGYFKQPDKTQEVIKDGWFYSGDLGFLDNEGYLFLTGRKKDVIVLSSGKNIYPEELEEYYLKGPYIKEICILSRAEKKFGKEIESLYAVIVPDFEYFKNKVEINIKDKIRWELENLAKSLPSYQHIMGFMVTKEELPRTNLRKIKRYLVAQRYSKEMPKEEFKKAEFSEEDARLMETEVAKRVINYLAGELKKTIYLDNHLELDLGIDSLSRVELALGLENLFKTRIPDEILYSVSTIKELILNIKKIISSAPLSAALRGEDKTWKQILSQNPPDNVLGKIRLSTGFLDKLLTFLFKYIFLFIFRIFWSLKIAGRENIPKKPPFIIWSNHASYLDGFFIFSSLPPSKVINLFFLGHAKIFEHPLVAWTVKVARLISIDPVTHLTQALQAANFVLKNKKIICIFPEGGRSIGEEIGEFKKGIGILVKEADVPFIPVYIKGSHYSWPRKERFPRPCSIKIIFGKPKFSQDLGKDYEEIVRNLREEVLKLTKE